jgi:hypothetical protein
VDGWGDGRFEEGGDPNSELIMNCRLYVENKNIVSTIKVKRVELAGDLVRNSDDMTEKKVFLGKPDGRRKAGRSKLSWLDFSDNDLKSMDVKEMEEESRRQICMGYRSERGTA